MVLCGKVLPHCELLTHAEPGRKKIYSSQVEMMNTVRSGITWEVQLLFSVVCSDEVINRGRLRLEL